MFRNLVKATVVIVVIMVCMGLGGVVFSAKIEKTLNVRTEIDSLQNLSVTVSSVDSSNNWTVLGDEGSPIVFGGASNPMQLDPQWKVWRAQYYYAVDVGMETNDPNWSLTIKGTSVSNSQANDDLDHNINVGLFRVLPDPDGEPPYDDIQTPLTSGNISYYSLINGGAGTLNSSRIPSGEFLRIYIGLGTGCDTVDPDIGCTVADAPDVDPIGVDKPAGVYSGTIEFSFTAN